MKKIIITIIIITFFFSLLKNTLFNKNIKYDEKKLMDTLKYFKDISKKVCDNCNKYGFKFFDICKDKNLVIQEAYEYILDCITKKH